MHVDGNLEPGESRIERLESVHRISLLGMTFFAALTACGLVYADELSASRIAIGVVGAAFVLAFSLQRHKVKSLLSTARHDQYAG